MNHKNTCWENIRSGDIMINLSGEKLSPDWVQISSEEYLQKRNEIWQKVFAEMLINELNRKSTNKRKCTKKVQNEK